MKHTIDTFRPQIFERPNLYGKGGRSHYQRSDNFTLQGKIELTIYLLCVLIIVAVTSEE